MRKESMIWKIVIATVILGLFAATAAMAGDETITGVIEKTDQGIILSADNGERFMVRGQDCSSMVGKSVKATGAVMEDKSGMVIEVTSVEEIKEGKKEDMKAPMKE